MRGHAWVVRGWGLGVEFSVVGDEGSGFGLGGYDTPTRPLRLSLN